MESEALGAGHPSVAWTGGRRAGRPEVEDHVGTLSPLGHGVGAHPAPSVHWGSVLGAPIACRP